MLQLAVFLASAVLTAQTASKAPEPVHTTVTVTATRSPLEIDNSPVSASTVSRQELENRNIRQIDQALILIEGVNAIRSKGPSDNDFGLGLRGFAGRSGQNRTLILVDGQPVNNSYIGNVNWSTFSVSEMERVEVARGPFSSLYGGNAMGGVVNLITRPVDKRRLELFGQYGNRDTTNYSISAADRFFGKLGLSFGYSRFQTGGYAPQEVLRTPATGSGGVPVTGVERWLTSTGGTTYQVGLRGRNWFNQDAWRTRAEYSFSPRLFASFQYMRQRRNDGYDAYTSFLRDAAGNTIDNGTVTFLDSGVTRRLTLTPANFIGTPTGAVLNIFQAQILATLNPAWNLRVAAGANRAPGDFYITPGANATLTAGTGNFVNQSQQALYGNIQLSHQRAGRSFIAGTETRSDRARLNGQNVPNYAFRENGADYDSQAMGKSLNQAGYVQYQRTFEKLTLVGGGRWDYWRAYDGANQTGVNQPVARYPERSANAFTGKLAASYTLPGQLRLRGSVGNAFRNPTVYDQYRDLVLSGILYAANPNINPEHLFAYEGGVQRPGRRASFDATLFENRVSDLIYRTTDFAADPAGRIRRLSNAGLARTRGAEASVRQRPFSWLELRQAYTFTNSIITRNDALPATVGNWLPYVPKHTLTYLATAARNRWSITWNGRYVSTIFSTDTNTDTVKGVPGSYDPFFEMDATFGYQLHKHVQFILNADNLLDRRYYMSFITPGRSVFAGFRIRL
ncbi:MAG: TonB-dependent receptor [Bryobacteraceae bacterium]